MKTRIRKPQRLPCGCDINSALDMFNHRLTFWCKECELLYHGCDFDDLSPDEDSRLHCPKLHYIDIPKAPPELDYQKELFA